MCLTHTHTYTHTHTHRIDKSFNKFYLLNKILSSIVNHCYNKVKYCRVKFSSAKAAEALLGFYIKGVGLVFLHQSNRDKILSDLKMHHSSRDLIEIACIRWEKRLIVSGYPLGDQQVLMAPAIAPTGLLSFRSFVISGITRQTWPISKWLLCERGLKKGVKERKMRKAEKFPERVYPVMENFRIY